MSMAKKKKKSGRGGDVAAKLRYGDRKAADLRDEVQRLRDLAAALEQSAITLTEYGDDVSVRIDSATKFDRGFSMIGQYIASVEFALISKKYER